MINILRKYFLTKWLTASILIIFLCLLYPVMAIELIPPVETRYLSTPAKPALMPTPETSYVQAPTQPNFSLLGFSPAGEPLFAEPVDFALDSSGRLFVLDAAKARVFIFDSLSRRMLSSWGKKGRGETELLQPTAIAINNLGEVLISNTYSHSLKVFDKGGRFLKAIIPPLTDAPKTILPSALATDKNANVYVADLHRHAILILDFKGKLRNQLGGQNKKTTLFQSPKALSIYNDLFIFVADADSGQIKKLSTSGKLVQTIPAESNSGKAQLKFPLDVELSAEGYIYVADSGNFRIAIFDQNGKFLKELKWLDRNGQPLLCPTKLLFDPEGNLFAIDRLHRRVIKISAKDLKY